MRRQIIALLLLISCIASSAQDKPVPLPEALKLKEDIANGRFVTAQKRITSLLHKVENRKPELIFSGAEIADMTGNKRLALTRYLMYVRQVKQKNSKLKQALEYLLEHGVYPDEYRRYVSLYGNTGKAWRLGKKQLDQLFEQLEGQKGLDLADFMMGRFTTPEQGSYLCKRLYGASYNYELGKSVDERFKRPLLMVLKHKTPVANDYGLFKYFLDQIHGSLSAEERVDIPFLIQAKQNRALQYQLVDRFAWMRGLKSEADRLKAGRKYLTLEPLYRDAAEPSGYYAYLRVIVESPQVFNIKDKALISADEIQKKFDTMLSKYPKGSNVNPNNIIHYLHRNYLAYDKAVQMAFLRKHIHLLDSTRLRQLIQLNEGKDFDAILAEWRKGKAYRAILGADISLLDWYSRLKRKNYLKQVVRNYLFAYPTSFDANSIMIRFVRNSLFTPEERIAPLLELAGKAGGDNDRLRQIIGLMKNEKCGVKDEDTWQKHKSFKKFATLVNGKRAGTNLLLSAHAKLYSIKENRVNPNKIVYQTAKRFLSNYHGRVPGGWDQAKNPQELVAYAVFEKHGLHVWDNKKAVIAWAELWAPRMGTGSGWAWMVNRMAQHKAHNSLFTNIAPPFVALVKSGQQVDDVTWSAWTLMRCPENQTQTPFSGIYGKMGALYAFAFLFGQRDVWAGKRQFLINEVAKIAGKPGFRFPEYYNYNFIHHFYHWSNKETKVPVELTRKLWQQFLESENKKKSYDETTETYVYGHYVRSGHTQEAAAHLKQYMEIIKKRNVQQQIRAINSIYHWVGLPVGKDNELQLGMRYHTLIKVLKPLFRQVHADDRDTLRISANLFRDVNYIVSRWKDGAHKNAARKFGERLVAAFMAGAYYDGNWNYGAETINYCIKDAVNHKDWSKALRLVTFFAGCLPRGHNWDYNFQYRIRPLTELLAQHGAHELSFVFINAVLKNKMPDTIVQKVVILKSKAAQQISGLISVGKDDPTYNLHHAAQAYSLGNKARAWKLTAPKLKLLPKAWLNLEPDYVAWALEQMRKQKMLKEALQFAFTILVHEKELDPEIAARVSLTKGDIQRDMQNFQAARIEYESLKNNRHYKDTVGGQQARFHLIELLIMTKDYNAAERYLARLADSVNLEFQAEAYYLYAWIAYDQQDYQLSKEYLNRVFKIEYDHVSARLLEGELKLKLPRGLMDTEVAVGNPKLKTIAIPGRVLTLKLQDPNLSVARAGAAIPVIVSTSKGKDREEVKLLPSAGDKTLFTGTIPTALGIVKQKNLQLELRGDDIVSYIIDPEFQKANDIQYPPKELDVRFNARLTASAGEILSQEEAERREMEELLIQVRGEEEESARFRGRSGRTVRPGSPIYIQVIDFDRDLQDTPDKVTVNLRTSSGDILKDFVLMETGPHSGIFRGQVKTGIPFPLATASDTQEGKNPNSMINSIKTELWSSLADSKAPKWVEVDTMSSFEIKASCIEMPDSGQIKRLTLLGLLDQDYETLAHYPPRLEQAKGGIKVLVALDQRGATAVAIRRYVLRACSESYRQEKTTFDRVDTPYKDRDGYMSNQMKGAFYLKENKVLELKFLQSPSPNVRQYAYVFIDGNLVLGGHLTLAQLKRTRRVPLTKGVHRLEILVYDYWRNSKVIVGYRRDDGTFEPMPPAWFSVEKNPELAEFLKVRGTIKKADNGFKALLAEPVRLRKLRWVFEEFTLNQLSVKEIQVTDSAGKTLIPVKEDFMTGTANRVIEISPGDQITVSYFDEKRLNHQEPLLSVDLDSSFYNGSIVLANEEIVTVNERRQTRFEPAKRCRAGDQLMIIVKEYDQDLTDERDTIAVKAETSSGESLIIKALETSPKLPERFSRHCGVFMATLSFGAETGGNTIHVKPGDKVTVSYLDSENTRPGIPVEREYSVQEAGLGKPEMIIYGTMVKLVEDKSEKAQVKIKRMRQRGNKDKNIIIYREQIIATHPNYLAAQSQGTKGTGKTQEQVSVSVKAPLLFEVYYPRMALHAGSILKVTAVSEAELAAAASENREPDILEVPMYVKNIVRLANDKGYPIQLQSFERKDGETMLAEGVFAGVVRMQIGSHGDPVDDLVVAREKEFVSRYQRPGSSREMSSYAYRVPTLLVSGSDVVQIRVNDIQTGKLLTTHVQLLSDGRLELLDSSYTYYKPAIHIGEGYHIKLTDPDQDTSNERNAVNIKATAASGAAVTLELTETLSHSGIFTGTLLPEFFDEAASAKTDGKLYVKFGDEVVFEYIDDMSLVSKEPLKVVQKGRIYLGADAELSSFTKKFKDPEVAVKTRFLLAEAMFEMAKDHRKLKQTKLASDEIANGKRILEEAMRDYPNTSLAAQGEFLLANLVHELAEYEKAIGRYSSVISHWPDSDYAARSQFKKAICLEKLEHYKQACEEYVRLTYLYPDSSLVADATARLGNYFYRNEKFKTAGRIFYKFQQNNPEHRLAPKGLFLAGQCHMRMKDYKEAIRILKLLLETYKEEHKIRSEAMYWLADSHSKSLDYVNAYRVFKRLTWDYPTTKWAKIARGRLTDAVYTGIEEAEVSHR